MEIRARVLNRQGLNDVNVSTDGRASVMASPPRAQGPGASLNGGELLCVALATCYCNDLYREAASRQIVLDEVEVTVTSEFGGRGEPARSIMYSARVESRASREDIAALLAETDRVAEIHNTLRQGVAVRFEYADRQRGPA
jgi:organic hydroperoxide reductase OsmC/OhrA